jgi:hypothetical protein
MRFRVVTLRVQGKSRERIFQVASENLGFDVTPAAVDGVSLGLRQQKAKIPIARAILPVS